MAPEGAISDPAELLQTAAVQVAEDCARKVFGWPRLKSFQRRAVEAWAAGRPCFVLSGTGSGKSACFSLPALVERRWHELLGPADGATPVALVISPLVSLMHDQAKHLRDSGVPAAVCSPQGGESWSNVLKRAYNGELCVIFMSPEMAVRQAKTNSLKQLRRVSLVAVDEAHCVSEWGHDFREEYNELSLVIAALDGTGRTGRLPPVIALTATCKAEVRDDVVRSLKFQGAEHVVGSMNRPNLHFSVEEMPDKARMRSRLLELFDAQAPEGSLDMQRRQARSIDLSCTGPYSSTVIYCRTKQDTEDVASVLCRGGVRAAAFHAGFGNEARWDVQARFSRNELQVVAATVAFGMGIDKPDVRRVLHFGMPKSLEAYMQESGRAGRDGCFGVCIVLFTKGDRHAYERAMFSKEDVERNAALYKNLMRVQSAFHYCRNRHRCRRAQLLEYLGEEPCTAAAFRTICTSQSLPGADTPGFCRIDVCRSSASSEVLRCMRCDNCDIAASSRSPVLEDASMELSLLLLHLSVASRHGRSTVCAEVRAANLKCGRTTEQWQRILDAAVHEHFVQLDIAGSGMACFAAPQLSETGRRWLEDVGNRNQHFLVDLGQLAPLIRQAGQAESAIVPASPLPSVEDPPSAPDVVVPAQIVVLEEDETGFVPVITVPWDSPPRLARGLADGEAVLTSSNKPSNNQRKRSLVEEVGDEEEQVQGNMASGRPQASPQRQKRRSLALVPNLEDRIVYDAHHASADLQQEFLEEVEAVRAIVQVMQATEAANGLAHALNMMRQVRMQLASASVLVEAVQEPVLVDDSEVSLVPLQDVPQDSQAQSVSSGIENATPQNRMQTSSESACSKAAPEPLLAVPEQESRAPLQNHQASLVRVKSPGAENTGNSNLAKNHSPATDESSLHQFRGGTGQPAVRKVVSNGCQQPQQNHAQLNLDKCPGGYDFQHRFVARDPLQEQHQQQQHQQQGRQQLQESKHLQARHLQSGQAVPHRTPHDQQQQWQQQEGLDQNQQKETFQQMQRASSSSSLGQELQRPQLMMRQHQHQHQQHLRQHQQNHQQSHQQNHQQQQQQQQKPQGILREKESGKSAPKTKGRTRHYTETEKRAASDFIRKLMEAADFNSNQTGGSDMFRRLIYEAKRMAPPELRRSVEEVYTRHFNAKTIGIHGRRLDALIAECQQADRSADAAGRG
eukprot:TRINITY_DN4948_c0_g2_i1.p1 TRINITY_DN4948_c0_g2~~TRINITY_DN4948_c0_g2_i1.p1  ORF type:complete len:1322 (-),score=255.34 TRINITY_DN4948_c0_g2_i1:564-4130(-)